MASEGCASGAELDFWPFSLEVYRQPGVEDACLTLQNQSGLDVNVLLFCCWTGAVGYGALSELEMKAVISVSTDWNVNVVQALRGVRNVLKDRVGPAPEGPVAALRQAVKDIELEAEWHEQRLLGDLLVRDASGDSSRLSAETNLSNYLAHVEISKTAEIKSALNILLDQSFGLPSGHKLN